MMRLEGRAPVLFTVLMVMLPLAVVSMALRIFVRLRLVKAFGIDDYLMLLATVSTCIPQTFPGDTLTEL